MIAAIGKPIGINMAKVDDTIDAFLRKTVEKKDSEHGNQHDCKWNNYRNGFWLNAFRQLNLYGAPHWHSAVSDGLSRLLSPFLRF